MCRAVIQVTANPKNYFLSLSVFNLLFQEFKLYPRKITAMTGKAMRPNVTKGERRIGRTIRKIEASVELSAKESFAKKDEEQYRQKTQPQPELDDSPVQSLRYPENRKKDATTP